MTAQVVGVVSLGDVPVGVALPDVAPLVGPGGHPAGPVEDLEWRTPDCPEGCGETEYDGDTLWCDKCGATWDRDGTGGVRHAVEP